MVITNISCNLSSKCRILNNTTSLWGIKTFIYSPFYLIIIFIIIVVSAIPGPPPLCPFLIILRIRILASLIILGFILRQQVHMRLIYLFTIERVAKHYNFKTHAPKLDDISNLHFITLSKYNEEIIYFVDKTGRITIQVFNNVPDLH